MRQVDGLDSVIYTKVRIALYVDKRYVTIYLHLRALGLTIKVGKARIRDSTLHQFSVTPVDSDFGVWLVSSKTILTILTGINIKDNILLTILILCAEYCLNLSISSYEEERVAHQFSVNLYALEGLTLFSLIADYVDIARSYLSIYSLLVVLLPYVAREDAAIHLIRTTLSLFHCQLYRLHRSSTITLYVDIPIAIKVVQIQIGLCISLCSTSSILHIDASASVRIVDGVIHEVQRLSREVLTTSQIEIAQIKVVGSKIEIRQVCSICRKRCQIHQR